MFGYHTGKPAVFLWQWIGSALFFLFPAIWGGRQLLRLKRGKVESENTLTPGWSNGILRAIFGSEAYWLRVGGFPVGVSILAVARPRRSA